MTVHGVVSTYLIQIDYGNATGGPKFPKQISREKEFLSHYPEIYIQSAPNNSNEAYTFMGLGRAGRFGQS